jgi:Skp family chaperone for outer membrane proteins
MVTVNDRKDKVMDRAMTMVKIVLFMVLGLHLVATTVFSEDGAAAVDGDTTQKLVKVCTLSSVKANQEFQRNVNILQARRQRVVQLRQQLAQAQTEEMKESLNKELTLALDQLKADHETMVKTYGFSLGRNYRLVVEKAYVYMAVSDEEAEKISQTQHAN